MSSLQRSTLSIMYTDQIKMIHSIAFLGPVPFGYKTRVEMRLVGGGFLRFLASTQEGEYSDFALFAMDLLQNKGSTVDLWDIDEEQGEEPCVLEYCPEDQIIYISYPGRSRRLVIYPLPEKDRIAFVRAFRLVAIKCLELEGLDSTRLFF